MPLLLQVLHVLEIGQNQCKTSSFATVSLNLSYNLVVFYSQKSETESLYTALMHMPSMENTAIKFLI